MQDHNLPGADPAQILFAAFTSSDVLSKTIGADGKAIASGNLRDGTVTVYRVSDLAQFAHYRASLSSYHALGYGVPRGGVIQARVVVKDRLPTSPGAIARSRDHFHWPPSDTILMIDHDPQPGQEPIEPTALVRLLQEVCPTLTGVEMLWTPSASSFIHDGERELVGLRGQRVYIRLAKGIDPKSAGNHIADALWARGWGQVVPSKAGTPLYRCPIDTAVWQPERLDFAGRPVTMPPLESRAATRWTHYPGRAWEGPQAAAVKVIEGEAKKAKAAALEAAAEALAAAEAACIETRVAAAPDADKEQLRRTLTAAVKDKVLLGDFILHLDGHGQKRVSDVLADRTKYHGATLADPLEPDYGGGRNKAKLFLDGATPRVNSMAHGGIVYRLTAVAETIEVKDGNAHEVAAHVADILAMQPDMFRTSAGLVRVAFDPVAKLTAPLPLDTGDVQLAAPQVVRFTRFDARRKQLIGHNLSQDLAGQIRRATLQPFSRVRVLRGITHAPTMTLDGRIIERPGYDEDTGLFYEPRHMFLPIPTSPDAQDVRGALDTLWRPFSAYAFPSDVDRAVLTAAVLTAVVRKTLPTAPAFAVSAVQAGSGKTKMARSIAALTCGRDLPAGQWPRKQDEIQKTVLSLLLSLPPAILFDNLESVIESDTLAAVLTSPEYSARKLQASVAPTVPTNSLFVFTGNNVQIRGDLNRRVLRINITPPGIDAHAARFDFDPLDEVMRDWPGMVRAALTLMHGYIRAGAPAQLGMPFGSFEPWCRMVRDCVMWLGFADPVAVIAENYEDDDEAATLSSVMDLWHQSHGERGMTLTDLTVSWGSAFGDAVRQVTGKTDMTVNAFAHWLGRYKDRPVSGRRFVKERVNSQWFYKLQQI